jgi:2-hydroxy-6-oxonona-2,4-dienedioate hydrolase
VIAYYFIKDSEPAFAKNLLWIGLIISAITTTIFLAVYLAYLNDMNVARTRIATAKVINTASGPIQYADVGHGNPVLVIHGAGGGFDQGLYTARGALGDDMESHYI